jgi:hypothetical protein
MKQAEIHMHLEPKKVPDLYFTFRADLLAASSPGEAVGIMGILKSAIGVAQSIYNTAPPAPREDSPESPESRGPKSLLSAQNAELGLLLINEAPACRNPGNAWTNMDRALYNSPRYNRIEELLGTAEWDNEANYNLLVYFIGTEKSACARYAWKRLKHQVYQRGNSRRLFRSPANREIYLRNQINFIIRIIPQTYIRQGIPGSHSNPAGHNNQNHHNHQNDHNAFTYYDLTLAEQIKYSHLLGDENPDLFPLWAAALDMWNVPVFRQLEELFSSKDRDNMITGSILKAMVSSERQEAWGLVEKLLFSSRLPKKMQQTILEALNETSPDAIRHLLRVVVNKQLSRLSLVVRAVDAWVGLGWENELETTIRSFLGKALLYLENPDAIRGAVKMENNAIVYMALWAQGVLDVEQTLPWLRELYNKGDTQKRTLALLFAEQTAHYKIQMPLLSDALADTDLQPLACAVNFFHNSVSQGHNDKYYNKIYPELFDRLENAYKRTTVKEKTYDGFLFSWMKIHFSKRKIMETMICLAGDQQERLHAILHFFEGLDPKAKKEMTALLLDQKDEAVCPLIGRLLLGGNEEQRLTGLGILKQLKKNARLTHECDTWIASFSKRMNISPEENRLLRALNRPVPSL